MGTETKSIPRKIVRGTEFYYRPETLDEYVIHENLIRRQYLKHITPLQTDVWLDAGAHIGSFSLAITDKVRAIYAYEPDDVNFALLQKNIALNSAKNIVAFQELVTGDWLSPRAFFLNVQRNKGSHSMHVKRGRTGVWRDASHIEAIMSRQLPVNKVKLDVEGSELEIIYAYKHWDRVDELVLEWHFNQLRDHSHRLYEMVVKKLATEFPVVRWNPSPGRSWQTIIYAGRYA